MSSEYEWSGVAACDAEAENLFAERLVTAAGTVIAAVLVSSIGVLMYLA